VHHHNKRNFWSRREFLFRAGGGISGLALADLLNQQGLLAAPATSDACSAPPLGSNPYAVKPPHFKPRAKAVISLFMTGGPSAVDLWVRETADLFERSLVRRGAIANSWFVGANVEGKPVAPLFYFGRADAYFRRLEKVADQGFRELLHRVAPAASPGRTNGSEIQEWRS